MDDTGNTTTNERDNFNTYKLTKTTYTTGILLDNNGKVVDKEISWRNYIRNLFYSERPEICDLQRETGHWNTEESINHRKTERHQHTLITIIKLFDDNGIK